MQKQTRQQKTTIVGITLVIFVCVGITLLLWMRFTQSHTEQLSLPEITAQVDQATIVSPITVTAEKDQEKALDLLQQKAKVDMKHYQSGVFISAINGITNTDQNYWALKKNGNYLNEISPDQLMLQKGESVTFLYVSTKIPLP